MLAGIPGTLYPTSSRFERTSSRFERSLAVAIINFTRRTFAARRSHHDVRNATFAARRPQRDVHATNVRSATFTRRTSAARRSRGGRSQRDAHATDVRSATCAARRSHDGRPQRNHLPIAPREKKSPAPREKNDFPKFVVFGQNSSPAILKLSILCRAEPDFEWQIPKNL